MGVLASRCSGCWSNGRLIAIFYKRPLEHAARDLGVSLILRRPNRSIFGAREVGVELPQGCSVEQVTTPSKCPYQRHLVMCITVADHACGGVHLYKSRWGQESAR